MIISASCDGSSVFIHHVEDGQPETIIASGELVLIPTELEPIYFTVPLNPWQGNGS